MGDVMLNDSGGYGFAEWRSFCLEDEDTGVSVWGVGGFSRRPEYWTITKFLDKWRFF